MKAYETLKEEIRANVLKRIDYSREISDEKIGDIIDEVIGSDGYLKILPVRERQELKRDIFCSLRRWDILQTLLEDEQVTEIMINGPEHIFVEREGRISESEKCFSSAEKLKDLIQRIVAGCNRTVNEASPIVDARMENGERVNVVLDPVAIGGPAVTIRRFPQNPITMQQLIAFGSVSPEAAEYLKILVRAGYNIFISGGTGSGKTTFLNVLTNYIPEGERVITIEDSAELQVQGIANLVRLETRNANIEGCRAISIRDLIRTALRMRPDRVIVGEVRGSEAVDMMQCLNTGGEGSMSTGHANSARDMLSRLETMVLMGMELPLQAVRQQIAAGIDIIIHLGRIRDKTRKVLEICEVDGFRDGRIELHTLFAFEEEGEEEDGRVSGKLLQKGELIHCEKLKAAGLYLSGAGAVESG
ncbi:MAG: CpaF family protein [Lachnospiraceae bacterium]|nr:CpaF family protein [Lachnospiraceae bacterium]